MIIAAWIVGIIVMPVLVLGIAQVFMGLVEGIFTLVDDLINWVGR